MSEFEELLKKIQEQKPELTKQDIDDKIKQKMEKKPKEQTFDPEVYQADFEKKVNEIDVVKGELKRDIVDYDELSELEPGQIKNLQSKIQKKLKEIEDSIEFFCTIRDNAEIWSR